MKLFEDADDVEDISKIETNQEFAKRFEHNKKREELQRFEELKKKGLADDSEDDSSESEDEDFISGTSYLGFFDVLNKIRKKDPVITQKDAKLFESESEEEIKEDKSKKAKKPIYLKDVIAKTLIEDGPELEEDEEEEIGGRFRPRSYAEEQDEHRKAFLEATEGAFDGEDDGDLLVEKKRSNGDEEEQEEDEEEVETKKKIDKYFSEDEDENEMFLKKFFMNKMWIDKDEGKKAYNDDLLVLSEDEDEVEKQEKYEAQYNFRFEENAGDRVLGHARFTDDSVRKKNNARKIQRESKKQRMAEAEKERREELKHMKNLKIKEMEEKLQKIRAIAGIAQDGTCALDDVDLDEDFDPEEHDEKMNKTFDVGYYDEEDMDPGFGSDEDDLDKPDFDKEDELLGLPKDWDINGSPDGFVAVREKISKSKAENNSENVEEELPAEGKRKRKRKISLKEKLALEKEFEEYYKLDYEDTIGDLKTRFKYTFVPSQRYGLNGEKMLIMDDSELNQYVPLKKIAPYRESEWKVPNSKRYSLKQKKLLENPSNKRKRDHSTKETGSVEQEKSQLDGEEATKSRRIKRRRRQAQLKLSKSRLQAYGLTASTSKTKKKH